MQQWFFSKSTDSWVISDDDSQPWRQVLPHRLAEHRCSGKNVCSRCSRVGIFILAEQNLEIGNTRIQADTSRIDTSSKIQSSLQENLLTLSTAVFSAPSYKLCVWRWCGGDRPNFWFWHCSERKVFFMLNTMLAGRLTEWNAAAVRVERYTYITVSECCLTTRGWVMMIWSESSGMRPVAAGAVGVQGIQAFFFIRVELSFSPSGDFLFLYYSF